MALAFGPIRNLFAYGFDGVLPGFVSVIDKKGHAWGSVLVGLPTVVFLVSYACHKSKGVPVELRFKKVPPD